MKQNHKLIINITKFEKDRLKELAEYYGLTLNRLCSKLLSAGRKHQLYSRFWFAVRYVLVLYTELSPVARLNCQKDIFKSQEVYVFEYGDKKLSDYGKQRGEEGRKES